MFQGSIIERKIEWEFDQWRKGKQIKRPKLSRYSLTTTGNRHHSPENAIEYWLIVTISQATLSLEPLTATTSLPPLTPELFYIIFVDLFIIARIFFIFLSGKIFLYLNTLIGWFFFKISLLENDTFGMNFLRSGELLVGWIF